MQFFNFLLKQFNDIKEKKEKELLKKIKILLTFLFIFPFNILFIFTAIPVVILIRIIRPIICIRFRTITVKEMGHFVNDAKILLCESVLSKNNFKDWYWLERATCNHQFERMVRRVFYVRWWVKYLYMANNIIPGGKQHTALFPRYTQGSRDIGGLYYKTKEIKKTHFSFSEDEKSQAKKYLRDIGIKEKDKFVCLLVRDPSYKNYVNPNKDWSYHDFRNSDINTYALAAKALAERGYWVFRMGKIVSKPFDCKHSRVIDYSLSCEKNDLLDIWLMAHCSFCVTTGTGLDAIAEVFYKPLVMVNWLPVGDMTSYLHCVTYFKHLRWKKNNKTLNIKDCLDNNYLHNNKYVEKGIDIMDLTEHEIKDVVLEAEERFTGIWRDQPQDIKLQEKFWNIFKKWDGFTKYHGFIHPEARISAVFLRNNSEWLNEMAKV